MTAPGRKPALGPGARRSRLALCIPFLLVVVVLGLYGQTARHGFLTFDDGAYITENPHVKGGLTGANVAWAFGAFHQANWHPLTWLSHQLDVQLFGLDAGKHHLVNVALHALNACLCFAFLWRASAWLWPSALAALLFAVHPQRVESVAWAAERKDVLSATFFFLALLAYERHARAPSRARMGWVALCLGLGLLAKPMLVTLPVVLLLVDVWPLGRLSLAAPFDTHAAWLLVREKLPLFVLSALSCLVTLVAQSAGGAVSSMQSLGLTERLATALLGTLAYLEQALWPAGLAFFYPHPALIHRGGFDPLGGEVWLAAFLLVGLVFGVWRLRGTYPMLPVGLGWMLVMLLPVIGLVQVGAQLYADRYAYLPLLGLTLAIVFGLASAARSDSARRALFALGLAAASALSLVTYRQVGTWRDVESQCERALAVTSDNYVAHEHIGWLFQREGELEKAAEHFRATLEIKPDLHDAHSNLGAVYMQLGRRDEAIAEYDEALRLVPDDLEARLNYGLLFERADDPAGARKHYEIAVREHPDSGAAWTKLGDSALELGLDDDALAAYRRAVALESDSAEARAGLGQALDQADETGKGREALAALEEALRLDPKHDRAELALAWLLATSPEQSLRDPARAQRILDGLRERRAGPTWRVLEVQAALQALAGDFTAAARTALEAAASAPATEWERLKAERAGYEAGRPLAR